MKHLPTFTLPDYNAKLAAPRNLIVEHFKRCNEHIYLDSIERSKFNNADDEVVHYQGTGAWSMGLNTFDIYVINGEVSYDIDDIIA